LGESQERARQFASRLFEYAERGRARALLDLMATSADSPGATDPTIFAVRQTSAQLSLWRKLMSQERREEQPDPDRLAQLALHIKNDEATLRRLEAELAEASPRFLQPDILSLDHVRRRLPPDTALLQYYFLGEDLLVWAITQEGLVAAYHAEQDARGLSREIRAFHKACANPRQRLGEKLGHSLSKTL
ncbi:MAG: hypothetical protein GTO49_13250, partial [Anaerolineae bacterium]|nr:hypothetical protein [Anaerolineae bacterium]